MAGQLENQNFGQSSQLSNFDQDDINSNQPIVAIEGFGDVKQHEENIFEG